MIKSIGEARQKMLDGGYTCVVISENGEYISQERGVKPLLSLLQAKCSYAGAVAADKCVGAGAAHLYVLLSVSTVWANVISEPALEVLERNGIKVFYGQCVPYIINRKGDGACPIESAVANAKTSEQAYDLILSTLAKLS